MKYITVICLILSGCATPGLWRYDNYGDIQKKVTADGMATLGYGEKDSHYIDVDYQGKHQAFSVFASKGNSPDSSLARITKTENNEGGVQWNSYTKDGKMISIFPHQTRSTETLCDLRQVAYSEIKEFREGTYIPEKVVGRVILTPFAVAADVVIVATSVIWFPLTIWMCKDLKNVQ